MYIYMYLLHGILKINSQHIHPLQSQLASQFLFFSYNTRRADLFYFYLHREVILCIERTFSRVHLEIRADFCPMKVSKVSSTVKT